MPPAKICPLFTIVRVFKKYCLIHSGQFYEFSGYQEVCNHHNTRDNHNNNLKTPLICSLKKWCSFNVNGKIFCNKLLNPIKSSPSIFSYNNNLRRHLSKCLFSDWTMGAKMWVLNASKTTASNYACMNLCFVCMDICWSKLCVCFY